MKFLLDVHISTAIADALAKQHEVVCAAMTHSAWSDARLLQLAADQDMIVVTQDSDFSDLIYAHSARPPPAIIYIRIEPEEQMGMAQRVIDVIASGKLNRHMAVIKPSSVRYRPLPNAESDNA